jgi:hypothetical protein
VLASSALELQRLAGNRAVAGALDRRPCVQREPPTGTLSTGDRSAELIDAAVSLAGDGKTLLLAQDVRDALEGRHGDAALAAEFDAAMGRIDALGAEEGPIAPLTIAAGDLVRTLERRFILDRDRSSLDLLGERRSKRYRSFAWDPADFPDGPKGPNEARASEMIRATTSVRPERRPNSTADAVVGKREVDRDLEGTIRGQFVPVEGQPAHKLHRTAAASFVEMRAAAALDGVTLHILDAHRAFKASRRRAARAKHKKAIADFSSHNLGLAVDLRLSTRRQRFRETRTSPFQGVVDMTTAPAHKWMVLRGASFGWYPYAHEPWHWEYNPPGFRDVFRESVGLPLDEDDEAGGAAPTGAEGGAESDEQAPADDSR